MNADPSVLILGEDVALPNEVGIAEVVWPGEDVTVVTWDTARAWAHQAAESVVADGIGCEVIDPDGEAVGRLSEVYFRGAEPVLITTKGGRLTRKRRLVPLEGALRSEEHTSELQSH